MLLGAWPPPQHNPKMSSRAASDAKERSTRRDNKLPAGLQWAQIETFLVGHQSQNKSNSAGRRCVVGSSIVGHSGSSIMVWNETPCCVIVRISVIVVVYYTEAPEKSHKAHKLTLMMYM